MRKMKIERIAVVLCVLLASVMNLKAQNTTSSIAGTATDGEESLAGAVVKVTHLESGTTYSTVSNGKGFFRFDGLRPGGPYKVEVSYVGHKKSIVNIKQIHLGEVYSCNVTLDSGNELNEVVITGAAAVRKTGGSEHITSADILKTPSIERSLDDITRLSPYFQGNTFGGRDQGMNNYSIDGANFNFNMGLDRGRLPAQNRPISIDALDEIQIVTSAFDVKNSNFMGASVNAVTKKGTNAFRGTAYTYFKNEDLRGNRIDHEDLGERAKEQRNIWGMTLGGPILKDKLFFFVNGEYEHSPKPIHKWKLSADGKDNAADMISRVTAADMERFATDLKSMYGWDPGSWTDFDGVNDTYRLLARLDWNISDRHHAMLRYNYTGMKTDNNVSGGALGLGAPVSNLSQSFRGSTWVRKDNVHSLTAEVNSRFSSTINNVLRAGFTFNDANNRESDAAFPTIDILKPDAAGVNRPFMNAGYEQHAYLNGINEKSWNIVDNLTMSLGNHFVTLGAAFESTTASNCYMRYGAGYYRYNSYDDFLQKKAPVAFALCYSLTGDERALSDVTYNRLSLYAQDEWNVNSRLRLLYGLRMDMPMYTNHRYENPSVANLDFNGEKLNTSEWPKAVPLLSPRIGFNYDITADGSLRLRGGTGIFTGRFPLIFLSKMQEGSGMLQTSLQIKDAKDPLLQYFAGKGVLTPSQVLNELVPSLPADQQKRFPTQPGAVTNLIAIDRNFKMPQVWKSTLAIDWRLPLPFDNLFTLEGTFAKDINAITAYDANIDPSKVEARRFNGNDNRYFYPGMKNVRIHPDNGYAYVMINTSKGYSANIMAQLTMTPVRNLDLMAAYTFTTSKALNPMGSNQIENTPNNLATVNGYNYAEVGNARYIFSPHRVIASASYRLSYARNKMQTLVSLFYEGRKNGSYSYVYSTDMNNDGINQDLIYIPSSKDELLFQDIKDKQGNVTFSAAEQSEAFWAFVNQDPYLSSHKGQYAEQYAAYNPWLNRFDLRLSQEFKVKVGNSVNRLQLNLDILNLGNLLNSGWGLAKSARTAACKPLNRVGVDANNTPIFNMSTYNDRDGKLRLVDSTYDVLRGSTYCWQMQIGVKYIFN